MLRPSNDGGSHRGVLNLVITKSGLLRVATAGNQSESLSHFRSLGLMKESFFLGREQSDKRQFPFLILLLCPSVSFCAFLHLTN